jgi:hypothetical protein
MSDQIDPLEVHNYAGTIVVFSKETGNGVRIELRKRLVVIDPGEARQIAHWLLEAADSMQGPETTRKASA